MVKDETLRFTDFIDAIIEIYRDFKRQGYYFEYNKLVGPNGEKSEYPKPKHIPIRLYVEEK